MKQKTEVTFTGRNKCNLCGKVIKDKHHRFTHKKVCPKIPTLGTMTPKQKKEPPEAIKSFMGMYRIKYLCPHCDYPVDSFFGTHHCPNCGKEYKVSR